MLMPIKVAATSSRSHVFFMRKDPESPWGAKWPQADPHSLTPELRDFGKTRLKGLLGETAPPRPSKAFPFTPTKPSPKAKK